MREVARRARFALVGLALAMPPAAYGCDRFAQRGQIPRGVQVGSEPVGGFTPAQAKERLSQLAIRLGDRDLAVSIAGQRFTVAPSRYAFRLEVDAVVDAAMAIGRTGSFGGNLASWARRLGGTEAVELTASFDETALRKDLEAFASQAIRDPPFEGAVAVEKGKPGSAPPRWGDGLDTDEAVRRLTRAFVTLDSVLVELPVAKRPPKTSEAAVAKALEEAKKLLAGAVTLAAEGEKTVSITPVELGDALVTTREGEGLALSFDHKRLEAPLARARALLDSPAAEARVWVDDKDKIHVDPSRTGTRIDPEAFAKAVLAAARLEDRRGKVPVEVGAAPKLSTEDAEKLGIRGLVSKFETRHPCCQKRVENIHRIADLLNGTIVRAGERFSVNDLVGPRTEAKGFLLAPSIADGEMVDTPGGGVSQFATTLYNAVLDGGYAILERKPHSFYFSRYPLGHEATLSFPHPDLVFKNDSDAAILIKVEYGATFVRVKLFGDNGGRKVQRKVGPRFDFTKPKIELVANDAVSPDDEKVKEHGSRGFSLVTSRIVTMPDGQKKEEKRTVVYKARERVLYVHSCRIPKGEKGWTGKPCPKSDGDKDVDAGVRPREPDEE